MMRLAAYEWLQHLPTIIGVCIFAAMAVLAMVAYLRVAGRIRETESHYRAVFQQANVGMARLTRSGSILAANECLAHMLLLSSAAMRDMPFDACFLDSPPSASGCPHWSGTAEPCERRMVRSDGSHFWARLTVSDLDCRSAAGKGSVFVTVEDVSETRLLREELANQAMHDPLTGLINRREIECRLDAVLTNALATPAQHTLAFLDIDGFKLINDACSHAAGDQALRLVAATLSNALDPPGWIGRLGGDEFAVLFEFEPLERGMLLASQLKVALAGISLFWDGRRLSLTASIGLVEINNQAPSVAWVLRSADTACYLAKESGRNRVRAYVESDREVVRRRSEMEWASKIRVTLAEGRLRLYAQRILPLGADNGLQYEVLLRLVEPSGEVTAPGTFLAAAEHFGMASAVDRKVLVGVIEFLSRHPEHLTELDLCHVNVSGQSATSEEFRIFVDALLRLRPGIAKKLCFELTETASIDKVQASAFITVVRAYGCRVALDDFGNGLSSFAYLKQLSVDIVKIDGIFVRDFGTDRFDRAVVRAVTGVCRSLGKHVVAEGVEAVETVETIEALREIGVDGAQGFAIHRPAPIEELVALFGRREGVTHASQ